MKHTIAGKVTWRVTVVLLVAMGVLFAFAYRMVYNAIYEESMTFSKGAISMYGDLVTHQAAQQNVPLDTEHTDIPIYYGDFVCHWCEADYVYLYIPDTDSHTITYVASCQNEDMENGVVIDHSIGRKIRYALTSQEEKVWNGSEEYCHGIIPEKTGYEIATAIRIQDPMGNYLMAGICVSYEEVISRIIQSFSLFAAIILVVLAAVNLLVYLILRKRVTKPAGSICLAMDGFVMDGKRMPVKLNAKGSDEFSRIAEAFNSMTEDIDRYLENIEKLTTEQTNRRAELEIAARIQQGFLPKGHLDVPSCEICAAMHPAKNVGGDLYDYVALDDHRILLVIADVSGKGMSAAMFMSILLVLIRQYAKLGLQPHEILRRTNDTLSESNAAGLFATAFVGIYDNRALTLTYANAGHDRPYLVGKTLKKLEGACGTLLGLFEGEEYTSRVEQLHPGDMLFLYTDGVSETVNPEKEFFGLPRLEAALEEFRVAHEENPEQFIFQRLRDFSREAEQFDDITMLTMTVRDTAELLLDVDIREIPRIREAILNLPLLRRENLNLCLAAEECFVNICSYAFPEGVPEGEKVRFSLTVADRIVMTFADGGMPYDPLENVITPEEYDMENQIGGLGKLIGFSMADDAKYVYEDGKNKLTLIKYFEEETV